MMKSILFILMGFVYIAYLYNTILTFFGWTEPKQDNEIVSKNYYFRILIPCHNEEEVIQDNLESIYNSTYDKHFYHVTVICDNCNDSTESKVLDFKKKHPDMNVEPIAVKGGSKPKALNKCIQKLKESGEWDLAEYVLILDSDNKISKTLLETYNKLHNKGNDILQCRILSDNDNSFIAKGFASAFNHMAYSFQIARNRLGLSASISGTGFSVEKNIFEKHFFKCDSLTEDLEFSVYCILDGYKVKYVHNEYTLNQNLDKLKPSIVQRVRWNRGHQMVARKMVKKLIKKFIKEPKLQYFDTLVFLSTPGRTIIYFIAIFLSLFIMPKTNIIINILNILITLYNIIFIIVCNKGKLEYFLPHLFYSLCMFFLIPYGGLTYKNTKWVKTKHVKITH